MKTTGPITLVISAVAASILASFYGIFQVSHAHALPVASINTVFTMPAVSIVLAALALPIYRYRKALLGFARNKSNGTKSASGSVSGGAHRPNPLNPFYAVRVLLLAKSTSVAAAILGGWHAGLVVLQLSTPVISSSIWFNVIALAGCVISVAVALAVEQICKLPDGPEPTGTNSTTDTAPGAGAA